MIDEATQILALINKKSRVLPLQGTFVAANVNGCTVDVGGGHIPAQWGTDYLPEINESVWVEFIDGVAFMRGPATGKAGQGTVVSVAGGFVTLTTDFGQIIVPYNAALTPTAGQVLKLTWRGGGYADSLMSTSPPPNVAPPTSNGGTKVHADKFTTLDAASWNGSWSSSRLWASNTYLGAAWYGTKIRDTIPSTAVVSRVQVYISPVQIQGNNPIFALHADLSRPAGAPSLSSPTAIAIAPGWVDLPNSFGDALKSGGGMAGIGLDHGGFNILHSRAEDADTAALLITSTY